MSQKQLLRALSFGIERLYVWNSVITSLLCPQALWQGMSGTGAERARGAPECLWTQICLLPVETGTSTKPGLGLQAVRGSCGPIKHQGINGSVQRNQLQLPQTTTTPTPAQDRAPLCWDGNSGICSAVNPCLSTSESHREQHQPGLCTWKGPGG